jgi:hypothetical protein
MKTATLRIALYSLVVFLALCSVARASAFATYSTTSLGGGIFQYNFAINNTSGTIPISGLLLQGGNSVFGLDPTSTISAPPGWNSLSPLPPFDDLLSYFSLTPATDVPIGGSLGGFTFQSTTGPGTLTEVDGVLVGSDGSQTPQTPFRITPEPATFYPFVAVLIGVGMKIKRRRGAAQKQPALHFGKFTVNTLPCPAWLEHSTVPRCDSAIQRTMARPSPKPPSCRERASPAR